MAVFRRRRLSRLVATADLAEMLVDAKDDENKLGRNASEDHADEDADDAGKDHEQSAERIEEHRAEAGQDSGQAEQHGHGHRKPVEYLDDRRGNESFPLKEVVIIKHQGPP